MHRIAAKVAVEILVLLQHRDFDAGARQQVAEHHARRSATHYATRRLHCFICHRLSLDPFAMITLCVFDQSGACPALSGILIGQPAVQTTALEIISRCRYSVSHPWQLCSAHAAQLLTLRGPALLPVAVRTCLTSESLTDGAVLIDGKNDRRRGATDEIAKHELLRGPSKRSIAAARLCCQALSTPIPIPSSPRRGWSTSRNVLRAPITKRSPRPAAEFAPACAACASLRASELASYVLRALREMAAQAPQRSKRSRVMA